MGKERHLDAVDYYLLKLILGIALPAGGFGVGFLIKFLKEGVQKATPSE